MAKKAVKRAAARRAVKRKAVKRRVVKKAVARRAVKRRVVKKAVARRAVKRAIVKRAIRRAVIARVVSERMGEGPESSLVTLACHAQAILAGVTRRYEESRPFPTRFRATKSRVTE